MSDFIIFFLAAVALPLFSYFYSGRDPDEGKRVKWFFILMAPAFFLVIYYLAFGSVDPLVARIAFIWLAIELVAGALYVLARAMTDTGK